MPSPASAPICGPCQAAPLPFAAALACVDYGAPWDQLIADFKFHDGLDLGAVFATAIAAEASRHEFDPATLLVPVPLAAARLRERGYNQAWQMARLIARRLRLAADPRLLLRVRETPHQLALPLEERADNVRGAFAVEPQRRSEVAGRHVAIVDDVMTTASTAAEIGRVLAQAGAASVSVWVFARTPRPGSV